MKYSYRRPGDGDNTLHCTGEERIYRALKMYDTVLNGHDRGKKSLLSMDELVIDSPPTSRGHKKL